LSDQEEILKKFGVEKHTRTDMRHQSFNCFT